MEQATILIIDDEEGIRISLRGILEDEGYLIKEAESAEEACSLFPDNSIDLILLDIWLPGMDGLAMLEKLQEEQPLIPVLMISGHGNIETAVTAIKKGAHDFIEKPLSLEKVLFSVERALEFRKLKKENSHLKERFESNQSVGPMGTSPVMVELRKQISRVAPLDTWVLITGENGTGKELVARSIHNASKRNHHPLVALNCAAIPDELIESELFGHEKGAFTGADTVKIGKFEMAHQGTLFLDEIGDMSLKTQAKILRILQEKTYERVGGNKEMYADVRVVAATNKDLEAAIAAGEFREDLYYRLRVFPLYVPPLRERDKDILLITDYMMATLAQELGIPPVSFSPQVIKALLFYHWPGNVRELKNFLERMIILHGGETLEYHDLPPELQVTGTFDSTGQGSLLDSNEEKNAIESMPTDFKTARNAFEALFLSAKLKEFDGNISRLAEAIGLERSYLHRKLKAYNIQGTGHS